MKAKSIPLTDGTPTIGEEIEQRIRDHVAWIALLRRLKTAMQRGSKPQGFFPELYKNLPEKDARMHLQTFTERLREGRAVFRETGRSYYPYGFLPRL